MERRSQIFSLFPFPSFPHDQRPVHRLENRKEYITFASKFTHEWNDHLPIFSHPQAIENSMHVFASLNRYFEENRRGVPMMFVQLRLVRLTRYIEK